MGKLLDNIKNAAMKTKQPQGQVGGATEATFQDLRQAGGKADVRGGPSGQSSLTEQLGIAEAQQGQQAVQDQMQQQQVSAGLTEQQQKMQQDQIDNEMKMTARAGDQEYQQNLDNMYNNLSQNYQKMGQEEKEMAMEQATFDQRLDNEQYVAGLNDRAARARLEDANEFNTEMRKQIMGQELESMTREFDHRKSESKKQDDYTIQRARSDAAFAMKMFESAMSSQLDSQKAGALGDLASAGAGFAVDKWGPSSKKETT